MTLFSIVLVCKIFSLCFCMNKVCLCLCTVLLIFLQKFFLLKMFVGGDWSECSASVNNVSGLFKTHSSCA